MSLLGQSLFKTETIKDSDLDLLFSTARLLKAEFEQKRRIDHLFQTRNRPAPCISLAFFEPSTRTRLSFQMAAIRLGLHFTSIENLAVTSISKGETFADTILNLAAMQSDALVVRSGENPELDECLMDLSIPVINAGSGVTDHPTQALLDAFTIQECRGKVAGERVVIVGDVLHSRVANSNLRLLRRLGAEVAYCAPDEFIPHREDWKAVKKFSSLAEAMKWATVCMVLRIQKERHQLDQPIGLSMADYRQRFRIGHAQMKDFAADGIVLHPGPVIRGIEISSTVLADTRSKVLQQVTNGVFIRAALLALILGFEVKG
jgi:aspartate carbamoyltransferase catalytic subunit